MQTRWKGLGLSAVVALAFVVALSGGAAATGSGYNQSYTQSAGHSSNAAVDLVSASTSYSSGPNISVSFSVSGSINYASSDYGYYVWFGGTAVSNATAYAIFTNGSADYLGGSSDSGAFGTLVPTISGGTLSFSIATALVGPASSFSFDVFAFEGTASNVGSYSWLGSNFNGQTGNGGGGTCTGTSCTSTSTTSTFNWWIVIIPVVVIILVIVVVLVLLMRKKPAQPGMMGQPGQPMTGAPGQPAWGAPPAPPAGQSPPPPPPPGSM
jgi:hypothetical protein